MLKDELSFIGKKLDEPRRDAGLVYFAHSSITYYLALHHDDNNKKKYKNMKVWPITATRRDEF